MLHIAIILGSYYSVVGHCWSFSILIVLLCIEMFKLVSSFQQEAVAKQQDAEVACVKLSNVRKMIAKLLKSMNDVC